jgi:P2 family phage contractile tail tube protein
VEECKLPDLKIKTEEFRSGGMDGSMDIDMGIEKLEATVTVAGWFPEMLGNLGLGVGSAIPLTVRGALRNEMTNATEQIMYKLQGNVTALNGAQLKAGERPKLELTMTVHRYEVLLNKNEIMFIDIPNAVRRINGRDQLLATRLALGV